MACSKLPDSAYATARVAMAASAFQCESSQALVANSTASFLLRAAALGQVASIWASWLLYLGVVRVQLDERFVVGDGSLIIPL